MRVHIEMKKKNQKLNNKNLIDDEISLRKGEKKTLL